MERVEGVEGGMPMWGAARRLSDCSFFADCEGLNMLLPRMGCLQVGGPIETLQVKGRSRIGTLQVKGRSRIDSQGDSVKDRQSG